MSRAILQRTLNGAVVALALGATAACNGGSGSSGAKSAIDVKAGDMPEGGEWTGVYYSPIDGYLHLTKDGSAVEACWRKASGEEWGQFHGEASGDLVTFEWKVTVIGLVGPGSTKEGKGYLRYTVPSDNRPHEVKGETGLGDSNSGTSWEAVKQENMIPDCSDILPDEIEGRSSGGGWDDEGGAVEGEEEEEEEGEFGPSLE